MRGDRSRRLTIFSETEKLALYGRPDFDDFQRAEFFAMTNAERSLALRRNGLEAQVYCLLQIGYFKAKQAFFPLLSERCTARRYRISHAAVFPCANTGRPTVKR